MSDVRDILELEQGASQNLPPSKEAIVRGSKPRKPKRSIEPAFKRPEGMHRELYALLYNDNRDSPPLAQSDTTQGYKQMKAKLGRRHVRSWKFVPFTNPARTDGAVFYHWRRVSDEGKEYPFAKFNKKVDVPTYSDEEYQMYLDDGTQSSWTRQETDHLFDLCGLFDLRFPVIQDRFDREKFQPRSIEDLKDRYYGCISRLLKAREPPGQEPQNLPPPFDPQHETERKTQLLKLYNRTPEQVHDEELLMAELRKIEMRKKEREKKHQDLQKLITAAENTAEYRLKGITPVGKSPLNYMRESTKKPIKKKQTKKKGEVPGEKQAESAGVKFPESKGAGVCLRSARMKMPASVGTKKAKAVEQLLEELGVDLQPMPTEAICLNFNDLRNDMILLYELKQAASNCEFELQTQKHRLEALAPGKDLMTLQVPLEAAVVPKISSQSATPLIDAVTPSPGTPNAQRKRRSTVFMEQSPMKKTKRF